MRERKRRRKRRRKVYSNPLSKRETLLGRESEREEERVRERKRETLLGRESEREEERDVTLVTLSSLSLSLGERGRERRY